MLKLKYGIFQKKNFYPFNQKENKMTITDFAGIDYYAPRKAKVLRVYIKGNYLHFYFERQ